MNDQGTVIDQSDDFVRFTIDGKVIDFDLYAARDALAKIDIKHRDDLWECYECQTTFVRPSDDRTTNCLNPDCPSDKTTRDESWLDDVVTYICSLGAERCSRRTAGKFYTTVLDRIDAIKKKSNPTPESPSGSESTPELGAVE